MHTGECTIVDGTLGGVALHIGSRVVDLAGPGQVLATRTVKDLVIGSGIDFRDFGEHGLKGVQGSWQIWELA